MQSDDWIHNWIGASVFFIRVKEFLTHFSHWKLISKHGVSWSFCCVCVVIENVRAHTATATVQFSQNAPVVAYNTAEIA